MRGTNKNGRYYSKTKGRVIRFKQHELAEWGVETRFSNLNVDFEWWEKGCKVCVSKEVERAKLLEAVLGLLEFVYSLSLGQVNILRLIYQNKRYWGLIEYTEEFEIWLAKKLDVSRAIADVSFKTLCRTKHLLEVVRRGKEFRVRWEMMPNPMEIQKGEFVMINLKLRVSQDTKEGVPKVEEAKDLPPTIEP